MAVGTTHSTGKLLNAADLARLPRELSSGSVDYELDNGRLVILPPPGHDHAQCQIRVGAALLIQGEQQGHGQAYTEVGLVLWHNPDRVVCPDAMFIANRSLPVTQSAEGYVETIPELVVEVRSKNDTDREIAEKVSDYQRAGVSIIWVLDLAKRTITEHRGSAVRNYKPTNAIKIDDLIPGFRAMARDFFPT
jgi:Uma2 family endonuclease